MPNVKIFGRQRLESISYCHICIDLSLLLELRSSSLIFCMGLEVSNGQCGIAMLFKMCS